MNFTLANDGDALEQNYWLRFLATQFPSYEKIWASHVVAVTRRGITRSDVRFRSDAELVAVGKTHEDIAIAQLHYTVMVHLGRAHELTAVLLDRWSFAEVLVRLTGASDCAAELLERLTNPDTYDPWSESAGNKARKRWREIHGRPLQNIHDYRNRIVHGRVVPEINATDAQTHNQVLIYPRLDKVEDYLDWRTAFEDPHAALARGDFDSAQSIARQAWERVTGYCETAWKVHLVPLMP